MADLNIIARTGAAIARHKDEAKKILAKYNITPEKDNLGGIIKAAFVAIKAGNKDLAADLVALVHVKGNTPAARSKFLDAIQGTIEKAKAKLRSGKATASNAEGDVSPISSDAQSLIEAVGATDIEVSSKAAIAGTKPTMEQLVYGFVIIAILIVVFYYVVEKLPKMVKA